MTFGAATQMIVGQSTRDESVDLLCEQIGEDEAFIQTLALFKGSLKTTSGLAGVSPSDLWRSICGSRATR